MVVAVVTAVAVIVAVTVTVVVVVVTAAQSLASYYCGCHATQSLAPAARREFLFVLRAFASFPFFCFFHLPSSVSLFLFLRFLICPPSTLAGFLYLLPVPRARPNLPLTPATRREFLFVLRLLLFLYFVFVFGALRLCIFVCAFFVFVPPSRLVRTQVSSTSSPFRAAQSLVPSDKPPRVSLCSLVASFSSLLLVLSK